jgi:hypothetical protein
MDRIKFNYQFSFFIFITAATSIYFTKGRTIFLLTPLLLYILIPKNTNTKFSIFTTILEPLCWVLATIVVYDFKFFNGLQLNLELVGDKSFYAQVSAYIKHTGIETYYFDYSVNANRSPIAYHYGENWITIFFTSLFNLTTDVAQELVAIPFMLGLGTYFIFKTAKQFNHGVLVSLFIVLLTLFFTEIPFLDMSFLPKINSNIDGFKISFYHMPKFSFSFMCATAILYSMALDDWKVSPETIVLSLFAFIGCVSFLSVCGILLLIQTIQAKKIELKSVLLAMLFFVYFVVFYFLMAKSNKATSYNTFDSSLFGNCISLVSYTKTLVNIIGLSTLQIIVVVSPFLVLLILVRNYFFTNLKWPLYTMCLCLFLGLFCWALFWYSLGSVSLFVDAPFIVFKIICITVCSSVALSHFATNKFIISSFMVVLFAVILPNMYNFVFTNTQPTTLFAKDTQRFLNINKNIPFLYFRHYNVNANAFSTNLLVAPQVSAITAITANHYGVFANAHTIKKSNDCLTYSRDNSLINTSTFELFKAKNSAITNDSLLINTFAKTNGVKYIIADANFKLTQQNEGLYKYLNYKLVGTSKPYLIYSIVN